MGQCLKLIDYAQLANIHQDLTKAESFIVKKLYEVLNYVHSYENLKTLYKVLNLIYIYLFIFIYLLKQSSKPSYLV